MQKLENLHNSNNYYTKLLSRCQFLNIMILENKSKAIKDNSKYILLKGVEKWLIFRIG